MEDPPKQHWFLPLWNFLKTITFLFYHGNVYTSESCMGDFMINGWIHGSYKRGQGFRYKTQLWDLLLPQGFWKVLSRSCFCLLHSTSPYYTIFQPLLFGAQLYALLSPYRRPQRFFCGTRISLSRAISLYGYIGLGAVSFYMCEITPMMTPT